MTQALFSIGGITINVNHLLYIEPACICEDHHQVVAYISGSKENKCVVLVNSLKTFKHAQYLAEYIGEKICSDTDVMISFDDLEYELNEIDERIEEETESETEDEEFDEDSPDLPSTENSLPEATNNNIIYLLGVNYSVGENGIDVNIVPETNFLMQKKYRLEAIIDNYAPITLTTCNSEEVAQKCKTIFLNDVDNGKTSFGSDYFFHNFY